MNVLIIEDETLTGQRLEKLLHTYDSTIRVLEHIPSVAGAVAWFESKPTPAPDLVFMDIHLEDDLAFRIIERVKLTTPIIFTTAYDEYTLQAFKANSIDYLLKPIDYDELVAALEKFKSLGQMFGASAAPQPDLSAVLNLLGQSRPTTYKDRFMVTVGPKIRSIDTADIAYFFVDDRAVFLTTREAHHFFLDYSLDKLAALLDPRQFFRVNRSFLVSLSAIGQIYAYSGGKLKVELIPKSPQEVFVSGDRITDFKEWLGK